MWDSPSKAEHSHEHPKWSGIAVADNSAHFWRREDVVHRKCKGNGQPPEDKVPQLQEAVEGIAILRIALIQQIMNIPIKLVQKLVE